MSLTSSALKNPTGVVVAVLLVALLGAISLFQLPIQLTPDISKPEISISTSWRAAAPEEIEAEIIERQENVLKGLQGLDSLISSSSQGSGTITLLYKSGVNLDRALVDLMSSLNQVSNYPVDATEPVISVGGSDPTSAMAWFALKPMQGNNRDISTYQDYVEEVIQPDRKSVV